MEPNDLFNAVAIGMQTMVGYDQREERPSQHGNCFSVFIRETTRDDIISGRSEEYRIVNFNVENLNALLKRGLTWPIQCKLLKGRTAIIHDPRIGERWYNKRYCETCCPDSLLPVNQTQEHEREEMRGQRIKGDGYIKYDLGIKSEYE